MTAISKIHAREILDSRGNPTVEVDIWCKDRLAGRASVPSGASTGRAEARELRDGDPARYDGRGVLRAVRNVNEIIAPAVVGLDAADQTAVDAALLGLDPTPQKTRLGANALLGVSLAAAHAGAAVQGCPLYEHLRRTAERLDAEQGAIASTGRSSPPSRESKMPLPMTNMISGGLHAGKNLDFQDFLIVPHKAPDTAVALEWIVRTYRRLGELLCDEGYEGFLIGDEGGYGPRLKDNRQAARFVVRAIEAAKLRPGEDVSLAIDVASSHFFDGSHYRLKAEGDRPFSAEEMIDFLERMVDEFPILSIEDGLAEEDWQGWVKLAARLGNRVKLIGDDLFATNPARIARGMELKAANAALIKVNQIGTLTETLRAMQLAQQAGMHRVVSARSGETEDTTIADLAVGTGAEQIKIGSIVRGERLVKYNRLLRIEQELGAGSTSW